MAEPATLEAALAELAVLRSTIVDAERAYQRSASDNQSLRARVLELELASAQ